MKGKILGYDKVAQTGVITGDDGKRYQFNRANWKSPSEPTTGIDVDFESSNNEAIDIYRLGSNILVTGEKNRLVAALLAFLFGTCGVYKFYLGYKKQGIIMLTTFFLGFILLGIPSIIIAIIGFVEFVLYITKSDETFQSIYIDNKRPWF